MNQNEVKRLFTYKDGSLFWNCDKGNSVKKGDRAGRVNLQGYRSIKVSGRLYKEHRLVFLMFHGFMPNQIDHVNRIKTDNRIENLRETNYSQNQVNTPNRSNETGFRGVRNVAKTGKFAARVYENGKEIRIGTFDTAIEASEAYKNEILSRHGDFVSL